MESAKLAALAALANGILPADEIDDGAAAVNAAARLADRIEAGVHAELYLQGLETAQSIAFEEYSHEAGQLTPVEIERVLALLRERLPAFFTQLRLDVSAMYLSDPGVWQRIGFPGPSTRSGGYADFDQPQTQKVVQLKEKGCC
jgi:hypothetical protein